MHNFSSTWTVRSWTLEVSTSADATTPKDFTPVCDNMEVDDTDSAPQVTNFPLTANQSVKARHVKFVINKGFNDFVAVFKVNIQ
jgi:hypothetical protein